MRPLHLVIRSFTAAIISWWFRATDRLYWRLVPLLAPGLRNSQFAYRDELRGRLPGVRRWLDLGCGHAFLPDWLPAADREIPLAQIGSIVGTDPDRAALLQHGSLQARVQSVADHLPFRAGSFDLVTANMVFEHFADPEAATREIARVLRPGGDLVVHTPNAGGYTTLLARLLPHALAKLFSRVLLGRAPEDVYPTYYRANSLEQLALLGRRTGLTLVRAQHVLSSPHLIVAPPLLVLELLSLRVLSFARLARWRPVILAHLRKPLPDQGSPAPPPSVQSGSVRCGSTLNQS